MVEIAIPLSATPRRMQRTAVVDRVRTLIARRSPRERPSESCCFGRLDAKDAMVTRGLAAVLVVGQGGPQR
jgi:hypothetical protein